MYIYIKVQVKATSRCLTSADLRTYKYTNKYIYISRYIQGSFSLPNINGPTYIQI